MEYFVMINASEIEKFPSQNLEFTNNKYYLSQPHSSEQSARRAPEQLQALVGSQRLKQLSTQSSLEPEHSSSPP